MPWFYTVGSKQAGPVEWQQLRELAREGRLQGEDLVWSEGMASWQTAASVTGLFTVPPPAFPAAPLPPPHGTLPVITVTSRSVETPRLLLRPFAPTDLDSLARINSDPEVMQFIANGIPWPEERTRLRLNAILNHWTRNGFGLWATIYKEDNAVIGFCGLQHLEQTPEVEVGYRLAKEYWGKGLATEGAAASIQYGFEALKLQRIVAVVHPDNRASRRVLEKCGMRFEKLARYYEAELAYYSISRTKPQE